MAMAALRPAESPADIACATPVHIVKTPGVMSGRARIKGTRVRVMDLVAYTKTDRMTVDEVADGFPQLPRAAIHAAFAYYFDHVEGIDAAYAEDDRRLEEFKRFYPERILP